MNQGSCTGRTCFEPHSQEGAGLGGDTDAGESTAGAKHLAKDPGSPWLDLRVLPLQTNCIALPKPSS